MKVKKMNERSPINQQFESLNSFYVDLGGAGLHPSTEALWP
jgi:hypothetical protein